MNNKTALTDYLEEDFFKSLETDSDDAKYIFDFFSFFANNPEYDNRKTRNRALRECLQHEWQEPRLNKGIKSNLLWSKASRDHYFNNSNSGKLVLEHIRPMANITDYIIKKIRSKEIKNSADMLTYLKLAHIGPVMAIITGEENNMLPKGSKNGSVDIPLHSIITERYQEYASNFNFISLEKDERFSANKKLK